MTIPNTSTTEETSPPEFLAFLAAHARGRTADQLSERMAELVVAVRETGKPGQITLTVKVTPDGKVPAAVRVEDKIAAKVPELDRPAAMWFATEDGSLSNTPPDQFTFEGFGG